MSKHGKLHPVAFGFAWGLISGIGWMLLCWAGARWNFGLAMIGQMSGVYYHLSPTFVGGLWGLFWGFIDLFVFGIFVALVYNCCSCYFCSSDSCDTSCK
jgi:ABC-type transporter Mla maintaining outer membrane lipid asymmetry permease subunit MlaE